MKVLQVTTHVNIGGIANYILSLSGALKAKGVDVVVASGPGSLEGDVENVSQEQRLNSNHEGHENHAQRRQ